MTQTNSTEYTIPIEKGQCCSDSFQSLVGKIQIVKIVDVGDAPLYVQNIVTTVALYIKQLIHYSKITIQQYLEHWHMKVGFLTGLSRWPKRLDPLLSSKTPILTKRLTYIASPTCMLNSKYNSHSRS